MIPHRFPFAFAEPGVSSGQDGLPVRLTNGSWLLRGGAPLSPFLALEILAQAALVQLPRERGEAAPPEGAAAGDGQPAIGGFSGVSFAPAWALDPPRAGDTLYARTELEGAFGPMLKVHGTLHRGDDELVDATLLLVSDQSRQRR